MVVSVSEWEWWMIMMIMKDENEGVSICVSGW